MIILHYVVFGLSFVFLRVSAGCKPACRKHYAPICGTNGKTYANRCIFNYAQCIDPDANIKMNYIGRCRPKRNLKIILKTKSPEKKARDISGKDGDHNRNYKLGYNKRDTYSKYNKYGPGEDYDYPSFNKEHMMDYKYTYGPDENAESLQTLAGEHYIGNYQSSSKSKLKKNSKHNSKPGRKTKAPQTLPVDEDYKYNFGNGRKTKAPQTLPVDEDYKYNFGNGRKTKAPQTLPVDEDYKYNFGNENTEEEMERHYINIQGDKLYSFGNNGQSNHSSFGNNGQSNHNSFGNNGQSNHSRFGNNGLSNYSSDLPMFELGPNSKDFIIKQVDKVLMTLNLMALKGNNGLGSDEKAFWKMTNFTNFKNNTNNMKRRANIKKSNTITDCSQLYNKGNTTSKIAQIFPYSCCPTKNMTVLCDQIHDGGRWTIILKRGAYFKVTKRTDFNLTWDDYVKGFGKLTLKQDGEYWIGLEALHDLTSGADQELFISLRDHAGKERWAKYKIFAVGGNETNYKLTVGGYSGDAGDSLEYHNDQSFSTFDKDNDQLGLNCALKYSGGWWFRGCQTSNLNGIHAIAPGAPTEKGIIWASFKGFDISLYAVTMKIRPII